MVTHEQADTETTTKGHSFGDDGKAGQTGQEDIKVDIIYLTRQIHLWFCQLPSHYTLVVSISSLPFLLPVVVCGQRSEARETLIRN